jgi:hypothetical protein
VKTFEILETLILTHSWSDLFAADQDFSEFLMVDDGQLAQLLAAVRFLKALLGKAPSRGDLFQCAQAMTLILLAAQQRSEHVRGEALEICSLLLEEGFDPTPFVEAGLPAMFFASRDGASFRLWNRTIQVLCEFFVNGSAEIAEYLIGIGMVEVLVEAVMLADERSAKYLMPALGCLLQFWKEKGEVTEVEKIAENAALLNAVAMCAGNGGEMAGHVLRLLSPESDG